MHQCAPCQKRVDNEFLFVKGVNYGVCEDLIAYIVMYRMYAIIYSSGLTCSHKFIVHKDNNESFLQMQDFILMENNEK